MNLLPMLMPHRSEIFEYESQDYAKNKFPQSVSIFIPTQSAEMVELLLEVIYSHTLKCHYSIIHLLLS